MPLGARYMAALHGRQRTLLTVSICIGSACFMLVDSGAFLGACCRSQGCCSSCSAVGLAVGLFSRACKQHACLEMDAQAKQLLPGNKLWVSCVDLCLQNELLQAHDIACARAGCRSSNKVLQLRLAGLVVC